MSINHRVNRLLLASQIVKLLTGLEDDGIINGNIDTPAVKIIPASAKLLAINAAADLPLVLALIEKIKPRKASAGASIVIG